MKKLLVQLAALMLILCGCAPYSASGAPAATPQRTEDDSPPQKTDVVAPFDLKPGSREIWGVPNARWVWFSRPDDVIQNHYDWFAAYYENTYIPELQKQLDAMPAGRGLLKEAEYLALCGLIRYAQMFIEKELPIALGGSVPELLHADRAFLPEGELASIRPGDTLEDARKRHTLFPVTPEWLEKNAIGFIDALDLQSSAYSYYADGKGLALCVDNLDASVITVWAYQKGYSPAPEREVGEAFDNGMRKLYCKDAQIDFGDWTEDCASGRISLIVMKIYKEEVWDEAAYDVNGDGQKERVALSGKSHKRHEVEMESVPLYGAPIENDLAHRTKTFLSVFDREGALLRRDVLPLYLYCAAPRFTAELPPRESGLELPQSGLFVQVPTCGTGPDDYFDLAFDSGGRPRLTDLLYS